MLRILIIDDDEDDVLILAEAIKHLWPEAICESSSIALWKSLINHPLPTLIFIDAFSSLGRDCLTALMTVIKGDSTTILVYTDESRTSVLEEFKTLGAYDTVLKTGDYEGLKRSLAKLNDIVLRSLSTHKDISSKRRLLNVIW